LPIVGYVALYQCSERAFARLWVPRTRFGVFPRAVRIRRGASRSAASTSCTACRAPGASSPPGSDRGRSIAAELGGVSLKLRAALSLVALLPPSGR